MLRQVFSRSPLRQSIPSRKRTNAKQQLDLGLDDSVHSGAHILELKCRGSICLIASLKLLEYEEDPSETSSKFALNLGSRHRPIKIQNLRGCLLENARQL